MTILHVHIDAGVTLLAKHVETCMRSAMEEDRVICAAIETENVCTHRDLAESVSLLKAPAALRMGDTTLWGPTIPKLLTTAKKFVREA